MAVDRGDGPTLREGIEWHSRAMRARRAAPRSLATLLEEQHRHLGDWLERPLASLSRHEVATRHEDLTLASGPWLANRVMQQLRAVYNTAARRCETLSPTNPTLAVTFNRLRRRREPIPWDELPAWRARVEALGNPVRRDLQWTLLLTGLRSLDARSLRWEHVDLARGTRHRPSPKGGPERAFTIPICRALRERLVRLRAEPRDDDGWVFPARDRAGRTIFVQCPKQQRRIAGRRVQQLPSPHRLRDTFATAAHEARVHPFDLELLMNHALPAEDDVTQGYIRPSLEHLAGACEAVAGFLLERAGRQDRSRTVVRLFEHGTRFVSRSEAKRLADGLERFREVELDFHGVEGVGQGFVDELLRVWARAHPGTHLVPTRMNAAVEFMVRRGLAHQGGSTG